MDGNTVTEHSERKAQVLQLLADRGEQTVSQLSEATRTSESNIRGVLGRLQDDGAVDKEGGEFTPGRGVERATFTINSEGQRWLTWWHTH